MQQFSRVEATTGSNLRQLKVLYSSIHISVESTRTKAEFARISVKLTRQPVVRRSPRDMRPPNHQKLP